MAKPSGYHFIKKEAMQKHQITDTTLNILLADDDKDDCLFFKEALEEIPIATSLTTVNDGEQLMQHLETVTENLPHIIFLDLNMPRKNGFECLAQIKNQSVYKNLHVIIYSTSYNEEKANLLFNSGAQYYICKPSDFNELKKVVHQAIILVKRNDDQISKENFCINKPKNRFLTRTNNKV